MTHTYSRWVRGGITSRDLGADKGEDADGGGNGFCAEEGIHGSDTLR